MDKLKDKLKTAAIVVPINALFGIVAFLSVLVMLLNLIVDISYGFLDPRIRYG